jgi:hypothetical protein
MAEVAKYRALRKGQAGDRRVAAGQVFEFEGPPGVWMEPVNGPGKTAREKADKERAKRVEDERDGIAPVDPNLNPRSGAPELIKSHPHLPNPEGSSGEEKGDTEPWAAIKRQENERAAARSEASREVASGRGGRKAKGKGGRRRAVSRKASKADEQPPRPQSDPFAPADDAGLDK